MKYTRTIEALRELKIEYGENTPLAAYTSFRIGGPARIAVFPKSRDQAVRVFDLLREENIRILVLGNGTNMLVSDKGFDGAAVILTGLRGLSVNGDTITADAGVPLTKMSIEASKLSLTGMEFAYGIPGTVGGGVYMNAGAYGGDMSQVVVRSEYYDLSTGKYGVLEGDGHGFAYRRSAYTDTDLVILSVTVKLKCGDREEITATMNDLMSRRREKQPLDMPSAGSTFKRGNGFITAQKIDEAGLKGMRIGGAQVSTKHAGFIVNLGDATASDVLALIEAVKDEIRKKFGLELECEVKYVE